MTYSVKEVYLTLQGEGANAGRAAVLCRFSGCNLWSGREADRSGAICTFCDTDFVGTDGPGGGKFSATELAIHIADVWGESRDRRFVVCTGGEPLLQLDPDLINELHRLDFEIAIETNGTIPVPPGLDWICVSPKAGSSLQVREGDELKLVFPQDGVDPREFAELNFQHFFLQPKDCPELSLHQAAAASYCMGHPRWRLSLQAHKVLGLP
jgi:7-carboxy-7-deazaguanine synthase (Cx14CxxC type)